MAARTTVSGTLDANAEAIEIDIPQGMHGSYSGVITSTATATLTRSINGGADITCKLPDGSTDAQWTSGSFEGLIVAPGKYKITASSVSGGSIAANFWAHTAG